ncbi:hypothetical protein SLCG_4356 [Streptomyces lincolnensis]|nr:hypothetical protein SLCG_4356 [Streptomyces lincolnensis]
MFGDAVMIGPHAHVNGASVGSEAFAATGASLFPGPAAVSRPARRGLGGTKGVGLPGDGVRGSPRYADARDHGPAERVLRCPP